MERFDPTPPEATVANANLWAYYFEQEWRRLLNLPPSEPVSQIAEGTAARVASFLTFVAAGPIAWMYQANAPRVTGKRPARSRRRADDSSPVAA